MIARLSVMATLSCLSLSVCAAANLGHYTIHGDASSVTRSGEALLYRMADGKASNQTIARARLRDGKFELEGVVDWITIADVIVTNGDRLLVQTQVFLEPSNTDIVFLATDPTGDQANVTSDGRYFRQLLEPLRIDQRYVTTQSALAKVHRQMQTPALTPAAQNALDARATLLEEQLAQIKSSILRPVYDKSTDPNTRLLAIQQNALTVRGGPYDAVIAALTDLQPLLPDNPAVSLWKKNFEKRGALNATAAGIRVGSTISDFGAADRNGHEQRLAAVLKEHRYVLVDFWASWCQPCLQQLPHLKQVYERFHSQGFEIVAFSLDGERAPWQKLLDQQKLPWINLSDLQARQSPIVLMFGVRGIPMNYLVDGNGVILAKGLNANDLEEKLTALMRVRS